MRDFLYILREFTGISGPMLALYLVLGGLAVAVGVQIVGHVRNVERVQAGVVGALHGGR